jgi:hypothetical protein
VSPTVLWVQLEGAGRVVPGRRLLFFEVSTMSDEDTGQRFNALEASHDQVQARLRQLGFGGGAVVPAGARIDLPAADPVAQRLAQKNQQRALNKAAREKALTRAVTAGVTARDGALDGKTATAAQVEDRIAKLGLSRAGLEPLRDARPAAPPPDPMAGARSLEAQVDADARELLALNAAGIRFDAKQIRDPRVAQRYMALRFNAAGFPTL